MQHATVSIEALGRLARVQTGGAPVLSLYLNLDPSLAPHIRDRRMELDSLLAEALSTARDRTEKRLVSELDRVKRSFHDEELAVDGARGLAVFSCEAAGLFEVLRLPDGIDPAVHLGERALIAPLLEMASAERWCVLLISSRAARVFVGCRESLSEVQDVLDDVHRRHSQGGWSQARYQRGIQKEIDDHIRGTCELLFERLRSDPFAHLAVGCPTELKQRVERELHPELGERLAGWFEIDVERASPEEVHRRVLPVIDAFEDRSERATVAMLFEGIAPGGHAVAGLDETLAALDEERASTLLVARGHQAAGWECGACARLYAVSGRCPIDGAPLRRRANVVGLAIEHALAQSVDVMIVRNPREMEPYGSIAALLRY